MPLIALALLLSGCWADHPAPSSSSVVPPPPPSTVVVHEDAAVPFPHVVPTLIAFASRQPAPMELRRGSVLVPWTCNSATCTVPFSELPAAQYEIWREGALAGRLEIVGTEEYGFLSVHPGRLSGHVSQRAPAELRFSVTSGVGELTNQTDGTFDVWTIDGCAFAEVSQATDQGWTGSPGTGYFDILLAESRSLSPGERLCVQLAPRPPWYESIGRYAVALPAPQQPGDSPDVSRAYVVPEDARRYPTPAP